MFLSETLYSSPYRVFPAVGVCMTVYSPVCVSCGGQSLDGIVQRDDKGLEKRFPVILTAEEKLMARKVSLAFKVTQYNNAPLCHSHVYVCVLYVFMLRQSLW